MTCLAKTIAISAGILAFAAVQSASADELAAPSRITAVTAYPDTATVTRTAQVEIPAGDHRIVLPGFPADLEAESIRVSLSSDAVQLGSVEPKNIIFAEAVNQQERDLRAELIRLQDAAKIIEDEIATATLQAKFLQNLGDGYAKEAWKDNVGGRADVATWQSALTLLGTGTAEAKAKIRDAGIRQRALAAEVRAAQQRLNEIKTGQKESYEIHLAVNAASATATRIEVSYNIDDVWWSPVYEARLDTEARTIALIQKAVVAQQTGEEWQNVALTLSTATPSEGTEAPELGSIYLDLYDPRVAKQSRNERRLMAEPTAPEPQLDEIVVTGTRRQGADLVSGQFSAEYKIPGTVSMQPDESENLFFLSEQSLDTELTVRSVPSLDTAAYLYGKIRYEGAVPLFAGDMSIFRDGSFVGTSFMDTVVPQDEMELALGVDNRTKIAREFDGGEKSDEGLFSRQKVEETKFLITVSNHHDEKIAIEIIDRLPVPLNDDIQVEWLKTATEPTEADIEGEPGLVYWRYTLDPEEERIIRHHYSIEYPSKMTLNRRNRN